MIKTFHFEHTAGASVYIRIFDKTGQPFDFDDNSFKANLAACTTPYKTCTERADMAGTGKSGYTVDVELNDIHENGDLQEFVVKAYANATPADADNPISGSLGFPVQFGEDTVKDVIVASELNVKSSQGTDLQLAVWLEFGGLKVALSSIVGTVFTADDTTDVITSVAHGKSNGDPIYLRSSGTLPAGLSTGVVYVRDKTDDTFKVEATIGGGAIDITDTGTGVHKFYDPTCTVTVREHGSGSDLFTNEPGDAANLIDDYFEFEKSNPNFTADRGYSIEAAITIGGVTFNSPARQVIW